MNLVIEEGGESDKVQCACCGNWSRCVNGYVYDNNDLFAVYFVHWTQGNLQHNPNFDLIIGKWGEGSLPSDKVGISVQYKVGHGFMVIDAGSRPFSKSNELFANALKRSEVIGTEMAENVYELIDAVFLGDSRIEEIRCGG